ncbi:hypothetical protein Tco_0457050, partial [Tanacetum coccineum]
MPEDPYVEAALQAPPSPDYVPGPEEPEHADDEIVAKDQPYAKDASPTAQSLDYVPESDPKADPEEDDDEDPDDTSIKSRFSTHGQNGKATHSHIYVTKGTKKDTIY